jgi:hypothetical protein
LLLEKEANGEDITQFKSMVKDFDPVISVNSNKAKKLLLLAETLKELLRANKDISQVEIPIDIISNEDMTISDIDVSSMISNFPSSVSSVITEKVNIKKSILELFNDIDRDKIDLSSFFVNISDGGENIENAINNSKKEVILNDVFRDIVHNDSDIDNISATLISINSQLNQDRTSLQKAVRIFDNLAVDDDIEYEVDRSKTILKLANPKEKDAKVGLALFELAEITNSPEVSSLLNISLTNGDSFSKNLLNFIKGIIDDTLEVKIEESVSDEATLVKSIANDTIVKLQNIESTLTSIFSDTNYMFKYDDINITTEQSKLLRAGILIGIAKIEYLLSFKHINANDIKVKTMSYDGETVEYNELSSNPLPILNRQDVGNVDDETRLDKAKNALLKAIDIYLSFDVNSITDEEERATFIKDQADVTKIKDSILGKNNYIIENNESNILEKSYNDFSAIFNPDTALELGSTLGHDFEYNADNTEYILINGTRYYPGEYNATLSQYNNQPVSNYWIAKDGSKIDANDTTGIAKLRSNPTNIPIGTNSTILNTIKKIEIIENNATRYTFNGDDILRYVFNEFELNHHGSYHVFQTSADVNITHKIEEHIFIPYNVPPTYLIEASGLADWLHSTVIDDKTILITADSNIAIDDYCYIVTIDVNGKRDSQEHCIDVVGN